MAPTKQQLTEAEWHIIKTVWAHQPISAPSVQEHLESKTQWHYSTVKTLMDRMVEKGLLKAERLRNLMLYRAAVTEKKVQKGEVKRTLARAFNGAMTPMVQFLLDAGDLSETQLDELEALIEEKRLQSKKRKGI